VFLSFEGLSEPQALWIQNFHAYYDDFQFFAASVSQDYPNLPIYVVAHSMGGFIAAHTMARCPELVKRAVFLSPMMKNLCGLKDFHYRCPLPRCVAYGIAAFHHYIGMGHAIVIGYSREKSTDHVPINVQTSDVAKNQQWMDLRKKYPHLIAASVTNDWTYHAINEGDEFEASYNQVVTNTLILR
jgi:lysophospholipase